MSGHFGLDFDNYNLDEPMQDIYVPGIEGLFKSVINSKDGAPVTVREGPSTTPRAWACPLPWEHPRTSPTRWSGTWTRAAPTASCWSANATPQCYIDLADMVVPEMQRRGRYRTAYNGPMLRDNLLQW